VSELTRYKAGCSTHQAGSSV